MSGYLNRDQIFQQTHLLDDSEYDSGSSDETSDDEQYENIKKNEYECSNMESDDELDEEEVPEQMTVHNIASSLIIPRSQTVRMNLTN